MTASPAPTQRFVAIGDSFTEGVGDPHPTLPNGVRGWADRVADRLAKAEPGWEYANLAIRSRRLKQIAAEQVDVAVAMRPTLITMYAGGNDVLDAGTDIRALLAQYESIVRRLTSTGARVLLFTGYDVPLFPALQLYRRRNHLYNDAVRRCAARYGATVVDYWRFEGLEDRRMWSPDRLHLSKAGHKKVAAEVLELLAVPHTIKLKRFTPVARRSTLAWLQAQRRWITDWIIPLVRRKLRRITLGDHLAARWPTPVEVPAKGGLRALVKGR